MSVSGIACCDLPSTTGEVTAILFLNVYQVLWVRGSHNPVLRVF